MATHKKRISRPRLLVAVAIAAGAVLVPVGVQAATVDEVATAGRKQDPAHVLERAAHPLRSTAPGGDTADLRALSAMIGDAKVVGLGEATHGSHEFFTMKERVFRHLVEKKGFTTFALELSWSAGLQIDDYLQTGKGDARKIAAQTLANSPWEREEFVSLIEWMRNYNRSHPDRPVHFMGDDIGAPSLNDAFFERVTGYVEKNHHEALPRLNELYTGLRPIDDAFAYLAKPLADRQQLAAKAQQALELVSSHKGSGGEAFDWAEQNARSIAQTAKFFTLNPADRESLNSLQRFRDEVMAQNVTWWQKHTGDKVLVSAHNNHVGYVSDNPELYSKTQGSFLRDTMGKNYLPVGFTFNQGSFLSKDAALGGDWKKFSVGAAEPGRNEHTLDQVGYRDFYLDVRKASAPARAWLNVARPTLNIGTQFPEKPRDIAIAKSFDILIHLNEIREAEKLKP
ncbi:erythromycin esterase family protein [Streptomyces sp. NBC_00503]|uniref:erythromycin esterase family protein n=1 Tax=Streptomyces sp. NBC_00503 TaxID=2903659 RepID=UPI002E804BA2|nr:erythromycin esterase family protein [Streptomyces sp. NBC_00503]WUD85538.1 erythromycin esterase family protein [Streptomyces sp. NBC_00503]